MDNKKQSKSKAKPQRTTPPITRHGSKTLKDLRQRIDNASKTNTPPPLIQASTSQHHTKTPLPKNKTPIPPPLIRASTPTETLSQTDSDYIHNTPSQEPHNQFIILSTPESQVINQSMSSVPPSRSESDLLDQNMEEDQETHLNDSVTAINLSGILNKTITNISPETSSRSTMEQSVEQPTYLETRGKRLKAALIIMAKASHHKAFMELV